MDILRAAHAAGLDAADELLRLDDGTPLPPELSEIRSLMLLKSELEGAPAAEPSAEENSSPGAARLAALQAQKAAHVADCLLAFDDASLFLHERVLEHERLVERLSALRRRGQTKRAAPQRAFDEAFEADDGVDSLGDWLDDAHLTPGLALRAPLSAAAGTWRGGGGGSGRRRRGRGGARPAVGILAAADQGAPRVVVDDDRRSRRRARRRARSRLAAPTRRRSRRRSEGFARGRGAARIVEASTLYVDVFRKSL